MNTIAESLEMGALPTDVGGKGGVVQCLGARKSTFSEETGEIGWNMAFWCQFSGIDVPSSRCSQGGAKPRH